MSKLLASLLVVLTLSGCGHMNPLTLARLAVMDPFANDPANIAVEIELPDGVSVPMDGVKLGLAAKMDTTGESFANEYALSRNRDLYRVAEQDLPRLRADIAQVKAWKSEDPDASSGSISVTFAACAVGGGPTPDALFSIRLSTDAGETMMPLMSNVPVARVLEEVEKNGGDIDEVLDRRCPLR